MTDSGFDFEPDAPDLDFYGQGYDRAQASGFNINKGRTWADWPFEPQIDQTGWDAEFRVQEFPGPPDAINPSQGSCLGDAGAPPDSGEYFLASIDGTCQWIGSTTCS